MEIPSFDLTSSHWNYGNTALDLTAEYDADKYPIITIHKLKPGSSDYGGLGLSHVRVQQGIGLNKRRKRETIPGMAEGGEHFFDGNKEGPPMNNSKLIEKKITQNQIQD